MKKLNARTQGTGRGNCQETPVHAVTKILAVFCAILCLVLAALTMAFAANADAIRRSHKSIDSARIAAESASKNEVAQFAQERVTSEERFRALQAELAARSKEVSDLQSQRTTLLADLERAQAESASIKNQIAQLGATTQTQASVITNYHQEVTSLRDELLSSSKREIDLVDRINDLESAREVLEQNSRALKEQLEEAKLAVQNAGRPGGGTADEPRELAGPLIRARVVDVKKSPSGEDLVVISEGANRGVKENALLHIVRGGDTFVGSVVITSVEPGQAVGKLNLYGKQITVQAGDMVLSRLTW
jgi:hypothetical protein